MGRIPSRELRLGLGHSTLEVVVAVPRADGPLVYYHALATVEAVALLHEQWLGLGLGLGLDPP